MPVGRNAYKDCKLRDIKSPCNIPIFRSFEFRERGSICVSARKMDAVGLIALAHPPMGNAPATSPNAN